MRELTQQEIDNSPGWATDYTIIKPPKGALNQSPGIRWSNEEYFQWDGGHKMGHYNEFKIQPVPIPRKQFDITNIDLSDYDIEIDIDGKRDTLILSNTDIGYPGVFELDKRFIILAAKHFKLTIDDLK